MLFCDLAFLSSHAIKALLPIVVGSFGGLLTVEIPIYRFSAELSKRTGLSWCKLGLVRADLIRRRDESGIAEAWILPVLEIEGCVLAVNSRT